jgi:hypothetical protein
MNVDSTQTRVRFVGALFAALVALGVFAALGTTPASASVPVAGVTFSSTATCAASPAGLEVRSQSNAVYVGSYAMIYLYNYRTGTWIHENQWHEVSGSYDLLIHGAFNFVGHGYYRVFMNYAQWTSAGYAYSGEYLTSYIQKNNYGYGATSTTCYI